MEEKDLIRGTFIITDARRVQCKISRRLNELKRRQVNLNDIEYIRDWMHKLYEIARERDYYAQKLHYAKRAFIFAFTVPCATPKDKKKN